MTTVFGIGAMVFLQDNPATAAFLSEEERKTATKRMIQQHDALNREDVDQVTAKFHWRWVKIGIVDPNTLLASFGWFFIIVPIYVCAQELIFLTCMTNLYAPELRVLSADYNQRLELLQHGVAIVERAAEYDRVSCSLCRSISR